MSIFASLIDNFWNSLVLMHNAIVSAHLQSGFVGAQITLIIGMPLFLSSISFNN